MDRALRSERGRADVPAAHMDRARSPAPCHSAPCAIPHVVTASPILSRRLAAACTRNIISKCCADPQQQTGLGEGQRLWPPPWSPLGENLTLNLSIKPSSHACEAKPRSRGAEGIREGRRTGTTPPPNNSKWGSKSPRNRWVQSGLSCAETSAFPSADLRHLLHTSQWSPGPRPEPAPRAAIPRSLQYQHQHQHRHRHSPGAAGSAAALRRVLQRVEQPP